MNKVRKAWAGFVDGRLYRFKRYADNASYELEYAVFTTRKAAKRQFDDVRRVEIVWAVKKEKQR
jgi:hypothetical protein